MIEQLKGLDVLQYAAHQQQQFNDNLAGYGHTAKTTFFGDLSIAEFYGVEGIKDTYNRVLQEWGDNVEYFAEFVVALNHKIWAWYKVNEEIGRLYNDLWKQAEQYAADHFNDDELEVFYNLTD